METYVILRRNGWRTPEDLKEAGARSAAVGEEMPDEVRWIRSYALAEEGGGVGTVCIYQAASREAIERHAKEADLPVDEIISVADTIVVREDPVRPRAEKPRGAPRRPASVPRNGYDRALHAAGGRQR